LEKTAMILPLIALLVAAAEPAALRSNDISVVGTHNATNRRRLQSQIRLT
jgi:hypothetical protein